MKIDTELDTLEERIYREIREFPERIDEMETRREDVCRKLARKIRELIETEVEDDDNERYLPL